MAASATAQDAEQLLADESLAEERLLEELENEEIPAHIREARLEALKRQAHQFQEMKTKGYGIYSELTEEKEFLDLTTSEEKCIVHFFHPDFRRCAILDGHLQKLSEKYFETKFAKINVEKAKFFVEKLKIRILPALFCFREGKVIDKLIGFEDLGDSDHFQTEALERRLGKSGVIEFAGEEEEKKTVFGYQRHGGGSDDSDED
ncbi:thioredoxin domain-containing protein plp1 [Lingula anatina]|uniref:Thioredoxin domain-containing protein 9 n=1 Tax=Lingula anatina TaxID=7574 RepID=A0A1S3JA94_LINAN|nr:thioredoxin domain-containing protein plp1 [Lingula anatina]|eukprot:XP_013407243.1 thioredoxin domain-containing protein plp1 [Lingula anatina]